MIVSITSAIQGNDDKSHKENGTRCVPYGYGSSKNFCFYDLNSVAKLKSKTESNTGRKGLATDSFCVWEGDILVLNVLGTPGAKKDAIGKAKGHQLKISVTAPPEGGRATDHMVKFLAKEFGVAIKDIEVVFGRFNINKQLRIKAPKQLPSVISKHFSQEPDE